MNPFKQVRWTVNHAASEFGTTARTLSARLKELGLLPGQDDKFSTTQICKAIFDDAEKQRVRSIKAQADHRELQNAEARKELIQVEDLAARIRTPLASMRRRISQRP